MKNLNIKILMTITALLLSLIISNNSFAEKENYLFQVNRKGGELVTTHSGFLGLIHRQYVGFNDVKSDPPDNNNVIHVSCEGKGVNRCRVKTPDGHYHTFSVGRHHFNYYEFENIFMEMFDIVESMVVKEEFQGEYTKKVNAPSNEGDKINISFKIVWKLDNTGNGKIYLTATEF